MPATILVVEDEPAVRELVSFHLERAGFEVRTTADAESAWSRLPGSDLVVLDRMLPGASGIDMLRRMVARSADGPPVLLLTALGREADRVEGLEAGADDYLVKPFGAAELVARVKALLRRAGPREPEILRVGDIALDPASGRVTRQRQELELTRREFELFAFLLDNRGRIFSRAELLDRVWGEHFFGTERTVDQHVAQLRSRLGEGLIETVRGRGYRLAAGDD